MITSSLYLLHVQCVCPCLSLPC